MKFPSNLCKNILKAFSSDGYPDICCKPDYIRGSFGDAAQTDLQTLQELCLSTIAQHWSENPQCTSLGNAENVNYFLQELQLRGGNDLGNLSEFVKDDLFWEKRYKSVYGPRFVATPPGKWLQVFLEKHLQEWLESLKASDYEEEAMPNRLELYGPYVQTLRVHNFQPPPKHEIHHVPSFHVVLQCLTELKSIDLSVNVKDAGDDFVMCCSNLSDKDINSLASGIELCDLEEFRLGGTKLSPSLARRLGRALEKCPHLKLLHLVDCSLGDNGVISFLMGLSPDSLLNIEDLNLANNFISSTGAFQLAIVLSRRTVKHLNLRLNPIKSEGACLLLGKLYRLNILASLNFSACSLDSSSIGIMICKLIRECSSLVNLNLSVNNFGDPLGWSIVEEMKNNCTLLSLDVRNTNLSPTLVLDEYIIRNQRALLY